MLKWTVMTRREPGDKSEQAASECGSVAKSTTSSSTTTTPRKTKRRRSSLGRRRSSCHKNRSSLEPDKENQFTSTPIKSPEGFAVQFDALRDVSNLTPTDNNRRVLSVKKCKSLRKSPRIIKKKKSCLNNHPDVFNTDSHSSNFFRPFEAVDSHIEGILADEMYPTAYAPTLPTSAMDYSPCPMKSTHCLVTLSNASPKVTNDDCPPSKKPKFDHVDDFLHQISFITSPEDKRLKFPGLKLKNSAKKLLANEFKVSPLVKKFIDLRFSKISLNSKKHDDSSYINDLSLDQLVDAILESSSDSDRPKTSSTLNTSILCNIGNETELEKENDLNETHEENLINIEHERNRRPSFDGSSTDSGFRSSTTENSHQLDSNYLCKCNNNNKETSGNIICDKTIININETFNERCVDDETRLRKRSSDSSLESEPVTKRMNLDRSLEENFTLRRQKCIRRKEKPLKPFLGKASSPILDTIVNDESFECTPLNSCYMENKDIRQETYALEEGSPDQTQRIRRCLLFDSPKFEDFSGISEGNSTTKTTAVDVRGSLDLNIHTENDTIQVHVIRCKDLYRPNGKVNAYVKVAIGDRLGDSRRKRSGGTLQRTAVQADSLRPHFNHTFRFPRPSEHANKRIHIEVWHRDRSSRTSELLGCMSFDVKDACEKSINGSYSLLPQSVGRSHNLPITPGSHQDTLPAWDSPTMCESQSSVEEVIQLDDLDADLKKNTNRTTLSEQQKHADENLFLRYLELDPTEGPDAPAAATQRKAVGNKCGRTPFTQTKRLIRPAKCGFGFSVVWTHPPRIERVEKGLSADKAGILPGDYLIFVDKHNVVMMPEIDILNLIRSYGSQLTLEIFRRNQSRNGSVPNVKQPLITPSATSTQSPTTSTNANTTANINLAMMNAATGSSATLPLAPLSTATQRRPSTVCSTNTTSMDYSRRKLHLPQVTFSSEVGSGVIV